MKGTKYLVLIFYLLSTLAVLAQSNAPVINKLVVSTEKQGEQGVEQKIVKGFVENENENLIYTYRIKSGDATLAPLGKTAILTVNNTNEVDIELVITNENGITSSKSITYAEDQVDVGSLYTDEDNWLKAIGNFKNHPSFQFQERNEDLPNVLIIGNSISIGYTPYVQRILAGKCNVYRIPENAGETDRGLAKLNLWLGDGDWDVIHFNFGLHDLKRLTNNKLDVSGEIVNRPEEYAVKLEEIVEQLKSQTDAALIWATTSVVPEGAQGRIKGDEVKYNKVASKIMRANHIMIDDQYKLTRKHPKDQKPKDVHFTPEGMERQAEQVVFYINKALH